MTNLKMLFLNSPWWLLLLIPAFFLALFPHLRIAKKYRRNRNRITSLVLHLIIVTLCILALSGVYFTYDKVNVDNQLLILVDTSYSSETFGDISYDKNDFVRAVLDESEGEYKVGVVTFGANQVYAAEMSYDTDEVYRNYLNSERPDDSASDIAAALDYARSLFGGKAGKVVLVTDGAQTDGDALMSVRMLIANGVQVNAAYFPNDFKHNNEVLVSDVILPEDSVPLDSPFTVTATVRARNDGICMAKLTLYDDKTEGGEQMIESRDIEIVAGEQPFDFSVTLTETGMHKLRFHIASAHDDIEQNNDYYTYVYIEACNNVLVIEREANDSDKFVESLSEEYNADVVNITDVEKLPKTLDALREYDEVILMNIANRDMPDGFIDLLYSYVHDIGGGLFTIGGTREDEYGNIVPNMYDRNDMYDVSDDGVLIPTLYQDMIPVQSINYTPPLGVMIIIDRSGSMSSDIAGEKKLDAAKRGAEAAVYSLSERDYCGIMTLDDEFQVEQSLIEATQQARLLRTINEIEIGGGTQYKGAIQRAGDALLALRKVERRHIIFISDGEPGDDPEDYLPAIEANLKSGITFSMVAIGIDQNSDADTRMAEAAKVGNGRYYRVWDNTLADKMSQELKLPEITEISTDPFQPHIRDHGSGAVKGVSDTEIPMLGGYFGTKVKDEVSNTGKEEDKLYVPLAGEFVPILAHWRYGAGRVGSFMCDLTGGDWSKDFIESDAGVRIINNTVRTLLPTTNIRSTGMEVEFIEDNYTTNASIFTEMNEGDRIELSVYNVPTGEETEQLLAKYAPTAEEGYTNIAFRITQPGVYRILISKLDSDGNVLLEHSWYKTFSYSKEYDVFVPESDCSYLTEQIAIVGDGRLIPVGEPWEVFAEGVEDVHNKFDPRWLFIIIATVLFLLDIAVRKFKWKWIHELVRERKEKRQVSLGSHGGKPTE